MGFGGRSAPTGTGGGPAAAVDVTSIGGVPVAAAPKTDAMSGATPVLEVGARAQFVNGAGTWDEGRSGFVGVVATYVGYQNTLPVAIFHAAPAVRADGSGGPLETDANGALLVNVVAGGGSAPSLAVVGGGPEATALRVTVANDSTGLLSVDDNGGSLTVDSPQLPATLGQKPMATSLAVTIASDQSAIPVSGSFASASVGAVGAAAPASADQAGFVNAGGLLEPARVYNTDSAAGTENTLGVVIRLSAGGGSVEAGTIANPLAVAVTNNIAGTVDQGASNSDPTDGWSTQLTDGTNFYTAANPVPTVNSPNATSNNTASLGTNFGTDGSISIKGSAGNVFSASVSHDGTTKRYIQLFDKASAPANGDTPLLVFVLPPATATVDSMTLIGTDFFGTEGTHFATGIAIGVSSTKNTFTEDSTSEKAINVKYK